MRLPKNVLEENTWGRRRQETRRSFSLSSVEVLIERRGRSREPWKINSASNAQSSRISFRAL